MFYVYILESLKDSSFYVGYTSDLEKRIARHNAGRSKFTKNKRPFKFVFTEGYKTRSEAIKREKKIKSYKGGVAFKNLLLERAGTEVAKRG